MNKMEKESNRKSNIELLRILAMIMIFYREEDDDNE